MASPQEIQRRKETVSSSPEESIFALKERDPNAFLEDSAHAIARILQWVSKDYQWKKSIGMTGVAQQLYELMRFGAQPEKFKRFQKQRKRFYIGLLREVRKKGKYDILAQFYHDAHHDVERFLEAPREIREAISREYNILYSLLCKRDKFLIGLRDGIYWQPYPLEEARTEDKQILLWVAITAQIPPSVPHVGKEELDLIPEKFLLLPDLKKIDIPEPAKSVEELLLEAYKDQRYLVPEAGALVRFRKAGDVEEVLLRQVGEVILAKVRTTKGEFLVGINLDTAMYWPIVTDYPETQIFSKIVAEVYRDLVTAVKLPAHKPRRGYTRREGGVFVEKERQSVEWTYIPRVIRIYPEREWREPLLERNPPTPHYVRGHPRKANMTDQQRERIREFERRTGRSILEHLEPDETYVLPYVSPKGTEDQLERYPKFIKRRIETEKAEEFRELLARDYE